MPFRVFMTQNDRGDFGYERVTHWADCATRELANHIKTEMEKMWPPDAYRSHEVEEYSILTKVETHLPQYQIGFYFFWTIGIECVGQEHFRWASDISDNQVFSIIDRHDIGQLGLPNPNTLGNQEMTVGQKMTVVFRTTVMKHVVSSFENGVFLKVCECKTEPFPTI